MDDNITSSSKYKIKLLYKTRFYPNNMNDDIKYQFIKEKKLIF